MDRHLERSQLLKDRIEGKPGFPITVKVASTAEEAVSKSQVICTVTTAESPIFDPGAVNPGSHFNAIGSFLPEMQEIPPETVRLSRIFVDNFEPAVATGDIARAILTEKKEGGQIAGEISELLAGRLVGRTSRNQITMFKSVGIANLDAVTGNLAYQRAKELGLGINLPW